MKTNLRSFVMLVAFFCIVGTNAGFAVSKASFHDDMRKLWEDHITWTRLYIISAVSGLPDTDRTAQRLLKNQEDIGNAVAAFYGPEAGAKLTALLKDHILIAGALVSAAKAGDQAKTADAQKKWYANADEIASFLSKANPKQWPLATMQSAMNTHLDQTLAEATHRIQGNYDQDIQDYEEIHRHILMLADTLSKGIIAQFPQKFSASASSPSKARRQPPGNRQSSTPGADSTREHDAAG